MRCALDKGRNSLLGFVTVLGVALMLSGCADVVSPGARNAKIPSPSMAQERPEAVNEQPDSVLYLPLGSDVLVPMASGASSLPHDIVGPFELRSETLAGALQLILADYEIPMAFETNEGMTRTITVTNLRGSLDNVVEKVCGLADLYCSYDDGLLVVKDTQTFSVTVPPVGGQTDILTALASGLQAITGKTPITETATRTIIYEATNRTARAAEQYFQRIRSNTALIVFEIYIWEVALDSDNAMGINWSQISDLGAFNFNVSVPAATVESPISIGLPTRGDLSEADVLEFISNYGAVKTISQPQLTVLSGAEAKLRAADTTNYVSSLTRSTDNGDVSISTETDSVDTGFTLTISSAWDNATIYGNINIALQEFLDFETFGEGTETEIQLPKTTERELTTQIRIRPGDSLLIAGIVSEKDQVAKSGPGFNAPVIPTSRSNSVHNSELVFLLKPRVIVYTSEEENAGHRFSGGQTSGVPKGGASGSSVPLQKEGFPVTTIPMEALNPSVSLRRKDEKEKDSEKH